MKTLYLAELEISHFRSFRNIVITLPADPGMVFVWGVNEAEPGLGANGSGKSSMWEALFWCLYGRTTDGLRASDVATWGSDERPRVKATFFVDEGEDCVVERIGSPERLTLNGEPVQQYAVDFAIGMGREQFAQSVMFGQKAKLFVDLSPAERANIFDGILPNLKLWKAASEAARQAAKRTDGKMRTALELLAQANGELHGIGDASKLEQEREAFEVERDADLEIVIKQVDELERKANTEQRQVDELRAQLDKIPAPVDTSQIIEQISTLSTDIAVLDADRSRLRTQARTFQQLGTAPCPTCGTMLDGKTLQEHRHKCNNELADTEAELEEAEKRKRDLVIRNSEVERVNDRQSTERRILERETVQAETRLDNTQKQIEQLEREAERIYTRINPFERLLRELQERRARALQRRDELKANADELTQLHGAQQWWVQGFREVRQFEISRALQHLEVEVANAAAVLGIPDWTIAFKIEEGERSVNGLYINVLNPDGYGGDWEAFSGGEAHRVRLAVSFGLARMIQSLVGVVAHWEVWDEPTQWLSSEGIEDLLQCLEYRAQDKTVFLLDHRALVYGGFSEVWTVRKAPNGSSLEVA